MIDAYLWQTDSPRLCELLENDLEQFNAQFRRFRESGRYTWQDALKILSVFLEDVDFTAAEVVCIQNGMVLCSSFSKIFPKVAIQFAIRE